MTPDQYLISLPDERKEAVQKLRETIKNHIPEGFQETINYGMIGYVVPHSVYPGGYHCDPKLPLPFVNVASQKNFIAIYHMGLYADKSLLSWFEKQYAERVPFKLDMGKSCIRFKKPELIPFDLIGELMEKMKPEDWIAMYENQLKK